MAPDPSRIAYYLIGSGILKAETEAFIYGHIYAPERKLLMKTKSEVFGSFTGMELELITASKFHQDEHNVFFQPGSGSGSGEGGTITYKIRWKEPK